jgi:hypothetical protein
MENIAELITDYQVNEILLASRKLKRKRKIKADCLTPECRQKMKRMAAKELTQYISTGVSESGMTHLSELSSPLPGTFGLKQKALQADAGIINASNI